VNAILCSPTTSFGRPYSFPTASLICIMGVRNCSTTTGPICPTHMHINNHSIPLVSIHRRSHHHQRIASHEISYASYALLIALVLGFDVEFEGFRAGEEDECTAQSAEDRWDNCHGWWCIKYVDCWQLNSMSRKGELLDVAFTMSAWGFFRLRASLKEVATSGLEFPAA